jgi:hypothetical protein
MFNSVTQQIPKIREKEKNKQYLNQQGKNQQNCRNQERYRPISLMKINARIQSKIQQQIKLVIHYNKVCFSEFKDST